MNEFLPKDPEKALTEIKEILYQRLEDVRRNMTIPVCSDDPFDLGIDCRLANEEMWLSQALDMIERS